MDRNVSVQPIGGTKKPIRPPSKHWSSMGSLAALLALAWFAWLMLRITLQYWPIREDAAFLRLKGDYLSNRVWYGAFYVHVLTSMFALAAGFTQFAPRVLRRWPALHRWMGRIYITVVCLVSGPASLIMARYANGGFSSRLGFNVLGILWIGTTAFGYVTARERNWRAHRTWMIRSYALTLSAVTLRLWKLGLVLLLHPHPLDVYRVAAWLGFVPNLLVAEWLVRQIQTRERPVLHAGTAA